MILLQSKDLFDDILLFDPETREKHFLKRSNSPEFVEMPISGSFSMISGHCLMLYRFGLELRFSIDERTVMLEDSLLPFIEKRNGQGLFVLKNNRDEMIRFEYNLSDLEEQIPGDITSQIGDEDFDFCQFVYNVLSNPERRAFIYRTS